jgi:fructokinase
MNQPEQPVVVGLGEVLWDVFPDRTCFGGAPANFVSSVAALTEAAVPVMVSGVGNDKLGADAIAEFRNRGVNTDHIAKVDRPTGTVDVQIDRQGKASYVFADNCAWDAFEWSEQLQSLASRTAAVCFGTLGQRKPTARRTIHQFVEHVPETSMRLLDINLRPPFYSEDIVLDSLRLANALKMNDEEAPLLAELSSIEAEGADLLPKLAKRWNLNTVAMTAGEDGALLWHQGQLVQSAGVKTIIVDTVGAGDSFTAAMTVGLLQGRDLQQVSDHACQVAAYVCSTPGATPAMPERLRM